MTRLLDEHGRASLATAIMMSHHAFRRDLAAFAVALRAGAVSEALADEWQGFRDALQGHHEHEDGGMFTGLLATHPELADALARLEAEHGEIDPVLLRGDAAFAARDETRALAIVGALAAMLDAHLTYEEATVISAFRSVVVFPPVTSDEEAEMFAEGFAWSSHGIAPEVLERVYQIVPAAVVARLPAARVAFAARCVRAWGTAEAGASTTSHPAAATASR